MQGMDLRYMSGFGGHFESEAVEGALPKGRNSPQRPPFGLYAEQLSGSSFTAPRHENRRSWLYRMRPTADHRPFTAYDGAKLFAPGTVKAPLLAEPAALGPSCRLAGWCRLRRRDGDDARQSRARRSRRRGGASLSREQVDGEARIRRCRRRTADYPAVRCASDRRRSLERSTSLRDRSRWSRAE